MRSHSGSDKARSNMRDPTIRERQMKPKKAEMAGRVDGDGIECPKKGQKGDGVTAEPQPMR